MRYLLIPIGVFILFFLIIDVFKTILYINGGGRFSSFIAKKIWQIYFKLARGNGKSPILNLTGGTILISLVLSWILMIWIGYSLIYIADPNSVLKFSTGEKADIIGNIYYVGYTLTSLGNGTYKAGSDLWRIISNIMGMSSMIFISLGISYLLPVLQAVVDQRTLAVYINRLGKTPSQIISKGYNGKDFSPLYYRFTNLEKMLLKHGESHLAYPILHFFHTNKRSHSIRLNLAILDEAISIQEAYRIDKTDKAYHWDIMRGAMDNLATRLAESNTGTQTDPPKFNYLQELPENLQNTIKEDSEKIKSDTFKKHRAGLVSFLKTDGWTWREVVDPSN